MKKTLCFLLSLLMLGGMFLITVDAAVRSCVTVGNVSGLVGETVMVPVEMTGNPGIVAMRLFVQYDASKLQLISVSDGGLFGNGNDYFGNDITENPYTLLWEDALTKTNYTANGLLAMLTFKINDGTPLGKTDVAIMMDAGSTFNVDVQNVVFTTQNGSVQICEKTVCDDQISGVSVQDLALYYKESGTLQTQVHSTEHAGYTIKFQPENEKLITVDEKGNVTTLHWGTTKLDVTLTDPKGNTWTDSCVVHVNYHFWQWIIIVFLFGWIWY